MNKMRTKKLIKNIAYFFLNQFFFFKFYSTKGAILMYHSVGDKEIFFNVRKNDFIRQMAYLKEKKFNVFSLSQLVERIEKKEPIPKKTVVLTFDDGYEDNYFNAYPVLKKHNFPATIFLAPDLVGRTTRSKQNISFKILDWPQIQEMFQSGLIDFQPHGLTHQKLARISLEQAKNEIKKSKEIIERRLDKKCCFFSYPNGDFNEAVISILRENGFKAALTVKSGMADRNSDLFKLPRKSVNLETNIVQFKGKLKFNLNFLK